MGPTTPATTKAASSRTPATVTWLARSRRRGRRPRPGSSTGVSSGSTGSSLSRIADSGINPGITEIHQQIDQDDQRRDGKDDALDERVVALLDGLDDQAAHARQRKDVLDDHRPA